jgi:hypothetical protein
MADTPDETPDLAAQFMAMLEKMKPMFEACAGMKAQIVAHGLSEETADAVVREFLVGTIRKVFNPPKTSSWRDLFTVK